MKFKTLFALILTSLGLAHSALAQGEALPVGTQVLEEVIFSAGDPNNNLSRLENLTPTNFLQFPDEILLVVYHTSW